MGAIGGLLGLNGGASGTGYNITPGTTGAQLNTAYNQNQNLLSALQGQNGIGNQSQVYGQLQNVASGNGPNPAQAMLNQATGQNVANQASLAAGQRGAASNVGLMSRQAAQTGANIQQQAAGQGATMQAQQALGALGQAGQMANTQAGQQIGATQNEQQMLQNANTAQNQVNAGLANTQMQGQQGLVGGLMNGVGGALGSVLAKGGMVGYADGGSVSGPQSLFGKYLTAPNSSQTGPFSMGQTQGAQSLQNGAQNLLGAFQKKDSMAQANANLPAATSNFNANMAGPQMQPQAGPDTSMNMNQAAGGGKVPAMVSPGEKFLKPTEAKMVAGGKVSPKQVGEEIPGKAKVHGDSYKNDTVKKDLEPGGVVIPRSVMQSKNPEKGAADFVRDVLAKKKVRK